MWWCAVIALLLEVACGQCTVVGRASTVVLGLWSQCILLDTKVLQFFQWFAIVLNRLTLLWANRAPNNFDCSTTYMIRLMCTPHYFTASLQNHSCAKLPTNMFQLLNVLLIFNTRALILLIGDFTTSCTSEKFPNIFSKMWFIMSILIQGQAKAHLQMFYIILVCSTDLICVLFTLSLTPAH